MAVRVGCGVREMQRRCRELRDVLQASPELCTSEDLTAYWPGGSDNPWSGQLFGWIYCYAIYVGYMLRSESTESQSEEQTVLAREAAADALRGAPIYVTLDTSDEDGTQRARGVFPKSHHALLHMAQRDLVLAGLADQIEKLKTINTPSAIAALGGALVECSYQQRVLCWIVCHEEPGLPFHDSEFKPDVDRLAPWTGELSPADVIRILQAHRVVNGARLHMVAFLLTPNSDKGRRPGSWETLISSAAKTLGRDARSLTRDTTLESLIAQVALAHEAEKAV